MDIPVQKTQMPIILLAREGRLNFALKNGRAQCEFVLCREEVGRRDIVSCCVADTYEAAAAAALKAAARRLERGGFFRIDKVYLPKGAKK